MSRQKDETQYNGKGKTPAAPRKKNSNLYVFRPTKEQRKVIAENWTDLLRNLTKVTDILESGVKLNLGYAQGTNALYASLRGDSDDWQEAPTVSVFHSDPERMVAMLAYFLSEVCPEFPSKLPASYPQDELVW